MSSFLVLLRMANSFLKKIKKAPSCSPVLNGTAERRFPLHYYLLYIQPMLCQNNEFFPQKKVRSIGNAMDNAIESCVQIADPSRRLINLYADRKGETVLFTVRNTFGKRPELKNGFPVTTKADSANHGYGLRNMRYLAEHYDGILTCRLEGEEFILTVLMSMN